MPGIQHIVVVKFKPDVSEETIDDLFAQLAELQQLIPGITHFSGGPYSSHEGLNQGFTHAFVMTFASTQARDNYLPHPEHERVKAAILPQISEFVIFDYELPGGE